MFSYPGFQPSSYFENIIKIMRKTRNEINTTLVLSRNSGTGSFGEDNLILFTGLKESLKPNCERILEILREMAIRMQNDRNETKVTVTNRVFRIFNFVQDFIKIERVYHKEKARYIKIICPLMRL